jgi:hypothetical protein
MKEEQLHKHNGKVTADLGVSQIVSQLHRLTDRPFGKFKEKCDGGDSNA